MRVRDWWIGGRGGRRSSFADHHRQASRSVMELDEAVAEAGAEPEVVIEGVFGWYWAASGGGTA